MPTKTDLQTYLAPRLTGSSRPAEFLRSLEEAISADSTHSDRRALKGAYRSLKKVRRTIGSEEAKFLVAATSGQAPASSTALPGLIRAIDEALPALKRAFVTDDVDEGHLQNLLIASKIWAHPDFDRASYASVGAYLEAILPLIDAYVRQTQP